MQSALSVFVSFVVLLRSFDLPFRLSPSTTPSCRNTAPIVPKKHLQSNKTPTRLAYSPSRRAFSGIASSSRPLIWHPAGQPRLDIVCTVFVTLCDQIRLIPRRRARTDHTHMSCQNIQQLWQLVQAGAPQKALPAAKPERLALQLVRWCIMWRTDRHGTKF